MIIESYESRKNMNSSYEIVVNKLVEKTQEILKDNLTGIYLHDT